MTDNPLISYGRKLHQFRIAAGYTQEEAALRIGVSKTSLRNWEKGRKLPTVANLDRLIVVYKIQGESIHVVDALAIMSKKELVKTLANIMEETSDPQVGELL